jgi:ABC-type Fe3+-siderophore transport system permease subunit
MLLIVLALFWVAILVPVVVRHFRESGTERSIESFHAEHEVLSRQEYAVSPAHRLDAPDHDERRDAYERPRLTVVHADDTYRSLETRSSWDEWSQDYDYDREMRSRERIDARRHEEATNRYASAYSSVPTQHDPIMYDDPYASHVSMRVRRTRIFLALLAGATLFTLGAFAMSSSIVQDLAVLSWIGLVAFVGLALYSLSQGYLHESSLPLRRKREELATIAPLRPESYGEYGNGYYEEESPSEWRRDSASRHAIG